MTLTEFSKDLTRSFVICGNGSKLLEKTDRKRDDRGACCDIDSDQGFSLLFSFICGRISKDYSVVHFFVAVVKGKKEKVKTACCGPLPERELYLYSFSVVFWSVCGGGPVVEAAGETTVIFS